MSRRRGFLYAAIKASEVAARQYAVAKRRQAAATTRDAREREREIRRLAAFDRAQHVLHGEQQVNSLNTDLAEQIEELSTLLSAGLVAAAPLDFATLKREPDTPPFQPGKLGIAEPPPSVDKYLPPPLAGLHALLPREKRAHAQATTLAVRHFDHDVQQHGDRASARENALADARAAHEDQLAQSKRDADDWNTKVGDFAREYAEGSPSAILDYYRLVLELLAGSNLLFLLEQHAGVKAKIEVPDTWRDPVPDSADAV